MDIVESSRVCDGKLNQDLDNLISNFSNLTELLEEESLSRRGIIEKKGRKERRRWKSDSCKVKNGQVKGIGQLEKLRRSRTKDLKEV